MYGRETRDGSRTTRVSRLATVIILNMLLVPILLLSFTAVADSASGRTSCTPGCRVLPLVAASVDGSGDSTLVAGMRAIQDVTGYSRG